MDQIRIRGLRIYAGHGVYEEEKKLGQAFYVDAVLDTDLRAAGEKDELGLSTDYGAVCGKIAEVMTGQSFSLIEAAAEKTAREILLSFPTVEGVELVLHKPQAPIPMSFEDVSVRIHRSWHTAYVALGSNLGDREALLRLGMEGVREHPLCRVEAVAPVYSTTPYGGVAQGDFLNTVMKVRTLLEPEELLELLQSLEQKAGRERKVHWGPRTLDLDLLFFDDRILDTPRLTVPHPDLQNRDFVLKPLCDIAPGLVHPVERRTAAALLRELEKNGELHVERLWTERDENA
ncbi:MAG TPA: 2-amino-4-hydroxy-6-hydroxymethyldihydropteridine diphosphokinase [Candidatus Eisenbergiella intestinipullorum]|nr:2-amino-4-hydroxy-6-hydroxymethyldihydropteridine diphosphokinase [Candidatus Eisenbergiella intestinipullorum]